MERVITLTNKQLQVLSDKASQYLNQKLKENLAEFKDSTVKFGSAAGGTYLTSITETNEFALLIPVKAGDKTLCFLAMISTERMNEKDDPATYVRVHMLKLDNGDFDKFLFFEPT